MGISNKQNGFTLVELVIAVSIIAILSTIIFVSYSSYVSSARDSQRITNIAKTEEGLSALVLSSKTLPTPADAATIKLNGTTIMSQGLLKGDVLSDMQSSDVIDPLDKTLPIYSIDPSGSKFNLVSSLENTPDDYSGIQDVFKNADRYYYIGKGGRGGIAVQGSVTADTYSTTFSSGILLTGSGKTVDILSDTSIGMLDTKGMVHFGTGRALLSLFDSNILSAKTIARMTNGTPIDFIEGPRNKNSINKFYRANGETYVLQDGRHFYSNPDCGGTYCFPGVYDLYDYSSMAWQAGPPRIEGSWHPKILAFLKNKTEDFIYVIQNPTLSSNALVYKKSLYNTNMSDSGTLISDQFNAINAYVSIGFESILLTRSTGINGWAGESGYYQIPFNATTKTAGTKFDTPFPSFGLLSTYGNGKYHCTHPYSETLCTELYNGSTNISDWKKLEIPSAYAPGGLWLNADKSCVYLQGTWPSSVYYLIKKTNCFVVGGEITLFTFDQTKNDGLSRTMIQHPEYSNEKFLIAGSASTAGLFVPNSAQILFLDNMP